jgi:capsid portal protein
MRAIGYGAMELIRESTSKSDVQRFCHIQAHTLRRHSDGRRVKQISDSGKEVWFVLYGENYDPDGNIADVHADTGEWYPYNSLSEEERANELVWIHEYAPGTNYYGRPPIIGSLASIQGVISAKKYNMSFFENYGLPAYAITITGDFADYDESPFLEELDENGNKIPNPNYDVTQTIRYKITQQIKQVIKNPHSAVCITIPSEGEEGNVDVKIQPLSVQTEEGGFRVFLKDERDEIIHAHKVDPSRIGIYDAGKLNGTNAGFTDNSYKYSTVAPIKNDVEDIINLVAREELDIKSWEYRSSDLDPKDYRNDIALAEFLFARASMTPRDLINNFGDQFGLTAPDDNPYLDEYYLNNQPLNQLWNNVENNPHLEATSILQSLENNLWSDDDEQKPKEDLDSESEEGTDLSPN